MLIKHDNATKVCKRHLWNHQINININFIKEKTNVLAALHGKRWNKKFILLYSLLNKKLERNSYSKPKFPSKWLRSGSAKLLHSLGAAKLLQTLGSAIDFVKLTKNCAIAKQFLSILRIFSWNQEKMQQNWCYYTKVTMDLRRFLI